MSVRSEYPLAYAVGLFHGAILADLFLIGGEVLAWVMKWRSER